MGIEGFSVFRTPPIQGTKNEDNSASAPLILSIHSIFYLYLKAPKLYLGAILHRWSAPLNISFKTEYESKNSLPIKIMLHKACIYYRTFVLDIIHLFWPINVSLL